MFTSCTFSAIFKSISPPPPKGHLSYRISLTRARNLENMRKNSFFSLKVKCAFHRTDCHATHTKYSTVLSGHLYQISPKSGKKCGQYWQCVYHWTDFRGTHAWSKVRPSPLTPRTLAPSFTQIRPKTWSLILGHTQTDKLTSLPHKAFAFLHCKERLIT